MIRFFLRAFLLVAAAGGPMLLYSSSDLWATVKQKVSDTAGRITSLTGSTEESPTSASSTAGSTGLATASSDLHPSASLRRQRLDHRIERVLRFDITPAWITTNWDRVTTGLAHVQMAGYRVLLVTGTAEDDLAGSLTYYFNTQQQLQRITFYGTTGDIRRLVRFVQARYGLARRPANDPALYIFEPPHASKAPYSALQVRVNPLLKSSDPYHRFEVSLILERPG